MEEEIVKTAEEIIASLNATQDGLRSVDDYVCGIDADKIHLKPKYFYIICDGASITSLWFNGRLQISCEKNGRKYMTIPD